MLFWAVTKTKNTNLEVHKNYPIINIRKKTLISSIYVSGCIVFCFFVPKLDGVICTTSWVFFIIFLTFTSNNVYSVIWIQSPLLSRMVLYRSRSIFAYIGSPVPGGDFVLFYLLSTASENIFVLVSLPDHPFFPRWFMFGKNHIASFLLQNINHFFPLYIFPTVISSWWIQT